MRCVAVKRDWVPEWLFWLASRDPFGLGQPILGPPLRWLLCRSVFACRFCGDVAAARYALSAGCLCYPDDREQDLCVQHIIRASPRGSMQLVRILEPRLFWLAAGARSGPS
jgi:hypothetical protein